MHGWIDRSERIQIKRANTPKIHIYMYCTCKLLCSLNLDDVILSLYGAKSDKMFFELKSKGKSALLDVRLHDKITVMNQYNIDTRIGKWISGGNNPKIDSAK